MSRRVVITGMGLVSPLGNTAEKLWEALSTGTSGVRELTSIPTEGLHSPFGAEARGFTGTVDEFQKSVLPAIKELAALEPHDRAKVPYFTDPWDKRRLPKDKIL